MTKLRDLTGMKFGKLTVIEISQEKDRKSVRWLCKCECGNMTVVQSSHLVSGHTKSCGCITNAPRTTVNGVSTIVHTKRGVPHNDPLYNTYRGMLQRCYNSNLDKYNDYGARGIKVCDEWQQFDDFKKWSIKNGWEKGLSIDRIDVNGDYCPNNCRWADPITQANNKRNNRLIEYNGELKTMKQWADYAGISYFTLRQRLDSGWTIEEAIKRDVKKKNNIAKEDRIIEYNGESKLLTEWSRELGIGFSTLRSRLERYGWSVEKAFTTPVKKSHK